MFELLRTFRDVFLRNRALEDRTSVPRASTAANRFALRPMEFLDRVAAGTGFTAGEGVNVEVMRPGREVQELGYCQGPLFARAQLLAEAYELHILPGIDFYAESRSPRRSARR